MNPPTVSGAALGDSNSGMHLALPVNGLNKMSSVGLPTGVEIRIVGENGKDIAPGSVGEIWIRGATVTRGYLNDPEANTSSFVDGWFRSGDLGSKDTDGYVFLRGRLKEMINRGGEKIWLSDVDAVLLSNPNVLEAASFGEADAIYGENVEAAVILRPGMDATESELREYCVQDSAPSRFLHESTSWQPFCAPQKTQPTGTLLPSGSVLPVRFSSCRRERA